MILEITDGETTFAIGINENEYIALLTPRISSILTYLIMAKTDWVTVRFRKGSIITNYETD